MSNLSKDVWSIVSSYIPYIDVCKINSEYIDSPLKLDFIRVIKERLNALHLNANTFIDGIIKYNIVISASFILQCLYGEVYEDSDIDLYIMGKKHEKHICYYHGSYPDYTKCNGCVYSLFDDYYDLDIWKHLNSDNLSYEALEYRDNYAELPIAARMYRVGNAKINIITINPYIANTVEEFINKYFDLNFCKVMFDGKEIKITNFDDVYNKTTHVNYELNKYLRRSFRSDSNPTDEYLKVLIDRRIEKYRKRGFTITVD